MRLSHKIKVKSKKIGYGKITYYKLLSTSNHYEFNASRIGATVKPKSKKHSIKFFM